VSRDGLVIREIEPGDQRALLLLNNAAVPHVNALVAEQMAWLLEHCDYARLAERVESPGGIRETVGFVLAIRNGTSYWSANYQWFAARYGVFLYLDRVVIAPTARRMGVGRALYEDLAVFAAARWPRVTLEVNLEPPNPGSHHFHAAMGFTAVGERRYDGGAVVMMAREVSPPGRD